MCGAGCVPGDHGLAVTINATSADHGLGWESDESYRLDVSTKGGVVRAQVLAATVWGARHGVQTLAQLFTATAMPATSAGTAPRMTLLAAGTAHVSDAPRYPHRGVLLDTARHFLPLAALLRTVDAMAASKLNVLHWHATDSHSFPLLLPSAPQLARLGAYSAREVYTPAAVASLLRYARLRGVRVLLEIDAPAHCSAGWTWGEAAGLGPLVLCPAKQPWRSYCIQPPCGQLNPANPAVYAVLGAIYRDLVRALPPGEALHLGGDEVFFPCWNASREVTDYLAATGRGDRGDADFLSLWAEFHAGSLAALDAAAGHSQTPAVLWSSHLTRPPYLESYVDKSRYVIESWTEANDPLPEQLLARGYRVILAAKDAWYLDHGWWGRTTYRSWKVVRDRRLPSSSGTPGVVLGGEAALWGELTDAANLDAKLWPRAAALAERLWSDPAESSTAPGVEARFLAHRQRLLALGVNAEAVSPEWCQLRDGECA
ncbi:hypothetical protein ONE63_003640 [Megalurothrips usitatus]|uniref:Beta-hexosaminidase n=1 Tax=Megalurothrips usitatus TaxID=439358 RepID=A0AAV7X740_9NEOP|nr:hypothetical protein ONE63_003640 [Megalurothrips usitatus]